MSLKVHLRGLAYYALRYGGVLDRRASKGEGWATVLVFHSVDPMAPEDGLNISPARFRSIVRMLKHRYEVLSLDEVVDRLEAGAGFSGREVAITFDDGYRNNHEHAAPALADEGLPACFFLTAGRVGTDHRFPWNIERGIDLPMMSWKEARELADMGFGIGSHTWSHPDLGKEPLSSAPTEIDRARKTLEDRLGVPVTHFAYPFGGRANIREEWVDRIRQAGFRSNSSAVDKPVTAKSDPYLLPRLGAAPQRSLAELRIDIDQAW